MRQYSITFRGGGSVMESVPQVLRSVRAILTRDYQDGAEITIRCREVPGDVFHQDKKLGQGTHRGPKGQNPVRTVNAFQAGNSDTHPTPRRPDVR